MIEENQQVYENIINDLKKLLSNNGKGIYLSIHSGYKDGKIHNLYKLNKVMIDRSLSLGKMVEPQYDNRIDTLNKFLKDYRNYLFDKPINHIFKLENNNVGQDFLYNIIQVLIKDEVPADIFKKIYEPFKNSLCPSQTIFLLTKYYTNTSSIKFDYIYDLLEHKILLSKERKLTLPGIEKTTKELQEEADQEMKFQFQSIFQILNYFINNEKVLWNVDYMKLTNKIDLLLKNHVDYFPKKPSDRKSLEENILKELKKYLPAQYWSNLNLSSYFTIYGGRISNESSLCSYEENVILKFSLDTEAILNKYPKIIHNHEAQELISEIFNSLKIHYRSEFTYEDLGSNIDPDDTKINVFIKLKSIENLNIEIIKKYLQDSIYVFESVMDSIYVEDINNKKERTKYLETLIRKIDLDMKVPNKDYHKKGKKI